jgi:hypothetical protein
MRPRRYFWRSPNPDRWCGEFEVPISVTANSSWEFQIQGRTSNRLAAGAPLIPTFASEVASMFANLGIGAIVLQGGGKRIRNDFEACDWQQELLVVVDATLARAPRQQYPV